jgi:hypothetical protein
MAPLFAILLRVFEDLRFVGSYRSVADDAELLHFRWRLADQEGLYATKRGERPRSLAVR